MTLVAAVRPACEADLASITNIYGHAVLNGTASYEYEPPVLQEMTARFDALAAAGFPYLVAEIDGEVAGYAYAGPFRTRPAYRFMAEDSIYLAPQVQGHGVGKVLLTRLISEVTELGFHQLTAVIGDADINLPSVRLHASLGFVDCGRIRASGYKFGRWCDTALMQLALNGGGDTAPDPTSHPERAFRGRGA